jgi:hypothetical protein
VALFAVVDHFFHSHCHYLLSHYDYTQLHYHCHFQIHSDPIHQTVKPKKYQLLHHLSKLNRPCLWKPFLHTLDSPASRDCIHTARDAYLYVNAGLQTFCSRWHYKTETALKCVSFYP